ncbi:DUF6879 family protein [Streptomyces sp. G45]|uniref:DUF6879 family protein n=1 Tax=Streptomyces sp. G45 TaxID=3406627 RepID=UPI003C1D9300
MSRLFRDFRHTAWRLETRRGHASDRRNPKWQRFLAGEDIRNPAVDDGGRVRRAARAARAPVRRGDQRDKTLDGHERRLDALERGRWPFPAIRRARRGDQRRVGPVRSAGALKRVAPWNAPSGGRGPSSCAGQ